jgi:hypothetical protein
MVVDASVRYELLDERLIQGLPKYIQKTAPNAATEPRRQSSTSKPVSMLEALSTPTVPATRRPMTANPSTMLALEFTPS